MVKNNLKFHFEKAVFILLVITILSFVLVGASGGSVLIQTVPEENVWLADGETVYKLDVYADNTGLNGESTSGAQWFLEAPSYFNVVDMSVPVKNDFFEGHTMFFEHIGVNELSARLTAGAGPSNSQGDLANYWFTVNPDAPVGETSFVLTNVLFLDGGGKNAQPHVIENLPFFIINPLCLADFNGDGNVGASDLLTLLAAWGPNPGHPADLDNNGVVGASDLLVLLASWGPCPEGLNGGGHGSGEAQPISPEADNILKDFLGEKEHNRVIPKQ